MCEREKYMLLHKLLLLVLCWNCMRLVSVTGVCSSLSCVCFTCMFVSLDNYYYMHVIFTFWFYECSSVYYLLFCSSFQNDLNLCLSYKWYRRISSVRCIHFINSWDKNQPHGSFPLPHSTHMSNIIFFPKFTITFWKLPLIKFHNGFSI